MKRVLSVVTFMLLSIFLFKTKVSAVSPNLDGNNVYANGNAITIEQRSDGVSGATIIWDEGEFNVSNEAIIFGGGNTGNSYNQSHITMNGGIVKTIYGGGNGSTNIYSNVENATIIIDGGVVSNAVYGGGRLSSVVTTSHIRMTNGTVNNILGGGSASSSGASVGTFETMNDSPNHTVNANITVSGGTIGTAIFGGGQGYSRVSRTSIQISDNPTIAYLIGSGSNGRTNEIIMNIAGGRIQTVQGINRGTIGNISMTVNGASIGTLYTLGDSNDASVNGKIDANGIVDLNIISGIVNVLKPGTNDGIEVTDTSNIDVSYADGTIINLNDLESIFANFDLIVPTVNIPVLDDVPQTGLKEISSTIVLIPLIIGILIKLSIFK